MVDGSPYANTKYIISKVIQKIKMLSRLQQNLLQTMKHKDWFDQYFKLKQGAREFSTAFGPLIFINLQEDKSY